MLELKVFQDDGMPSDDEIQLIDEYEMILDKDIKGPDSEKPNALFLARIEWNETCELIWRVYEPADIDKYLQQIIANDSSTRHFDYRIDPDNEWKLGEWHLNNCP